jgi:phosphoribosylanthranilate isomerase
MKIKVCGLRDPENIEAVAALSPDYLGFIFYAPSPRFADRLDPQLLNNVPPLIEKSAVFVDEDAATINALIEMYNFDAVQLHGSEDPDFCNALREQVTVFKAFALTGDFNFAVLNSYRNKVDFLLFDAKTPGYGGSGKTFDWALLNKYKLDIPFFLSGGISPDNIGEIKNISHPQFYGVDLNSKFETSPGIKDVAALEKAFNMIKQTIDK